MKIVVLNETFTKTMGYAENFLPKALAQLGHEVHMISADLQAYFNNANYKETYEPFNGPAVQPCGTEPWDGYTLHRLPHQIPLGHVRIKGLTRKLRQLRPDIVQTFLAASWVPLEVALARPFIGYKLFTGAHEHASILPDELKNGSRWSQLRLMSDVRRAIPGRLVGQFSEKCYATTIDCAEIAKRFYGVPERKISICPLGVDTDRFNPISSDASMNERLRLREQLGFQPEEIVCIYTGRFSEAKNPLCLAQAVAALQEQGQPYRGLFVGDGPQKEQIQSLAGCVIHPFVENRQLPKFYQASEVGVWPTQESTSMLDAAACGLPIIVSDRVAAVERIDGNGLSYDESNPNDLARVLLSIKDSDKRKALGDCGAEKISSRYSWLAIARHRVDDYEKALNNRS